MMPIMATAMNIFSIITARVTPTARASMLVATESISRVVMLAGFAGVEPLGFSLKDSKIIFPPTAARSPNATQWS